MWFSSRSVYEVRLLVISRHTRTDKAEWMDCKSLSFVLPTGSAPRHGRVSPWMNTVRCRNAQERNLFVVGEVCSLSAQHSRDVVGVATKVTVLILELAKLGEMVSLDSLNLLLMTACGAEN